MPRSSRSGSHSSSKPRSFNMKSSHPPPKQTTSYNHPQKVQTQQVQEQKPTVQTQVIQQPQKKPGLFTGFGQTIVQGFGFGAGSEIAHQALRGLTGQNQSQQQVQTQQQQPVQQSQQIQQSQQEFENPCQQQVTSFNQCLQKNSDLLSCQSYFDILKECQKSYQP